MKTINLKTAKILETTLTEKSISCLYQVLDDLGNVIINNRITLNKTDLPITEQNAIDILLQKLSEKIISKEL